MNDCSCSTCVAMCKRPCWPTPKEAMALINAGYAPQLMLDYWSDSKELAQTYIVCPAERGCEGGYASFMTNNGCVFLSEDNRCMIHHMKPREGREASCKAQGGNIHLEVAKTWDTWEGREVVRTWDRVKETK